eukprot:9945640-Lingulodinium_polyedra.AAC.1
MGVVLRQDAEAQSILQFAARAAFWRLPRYQLDKLALSKGISSKRLSLYDLVRSLVEAILPGLSEQQVLQILQLRGQLDPNHWPAGLTEEVLQEAMGKTEADSVKD